MAHKLIAWKVQDFKSLVMVALIELLPIPGIEGVRPQPVAMTMRVLGLDKLLGRAPILGDYSEIDSHLYVLSYFLLLYHAWVEKVKPWP